MDQFVVDKALSDRDILVGIFNLLANLAEKLTGEKIEIRVYDEQGRYFQMTPNRCDVKWSKS